MSSAGGEEAESSGRWLIVASVVVVAVGQPRTPVRSIERSRCMNRLFRGGSGCDSPTRATALRCTPALHCTALCSHSIDRAEGRPTDKQTVMERAASSVGRSHARCT